MDFKKIKDWWWLGGIVFFYAPVLLSIVTILSAIANDPEFFVRLFTEILTEENVALFENMHAMLNDIYDRVNALEQKVGR